MNKLTSTSKNLMSFFLDNNCINHVEQTAKTKKIITKLFKELKQADTDIKLKKQTEGSKFYKINIEKIVSISQVPKPKTFNASSFPKEIREHIDTATNYSLSYTFSLFDRNINILFIVEETNPQLQIEYYNEYVEKILVWLYIINEYSSKKCSKNITLYIYFTSLKKKLPISNIDILGENNVNTAFTHTCPANSEIVIFRKEEWFKVLMHETFHNFALDFSDMNSQSSICKERVLSIFPINSNVNLYEAYTEFWAELMNAVFCSYYLTTNKINKQLQTVSESELMSELLSNFDFFINFERTYGFFQLVKTLDFMGITYKDLYSKKTESVALRNTLYKENSNILSYYIIRPILMNNYQGFLSWCSKNNFSLLQFKKTNKNLEEFCNFIKTNYKTKSMVDSINCMQKFICKLKKMKHNKNSNESIDFALSNMRMSLCELG
jgi:hypothetical protein